MKKFSCVIIYNNLQYSCPLGNKQTFSVAEIVKKKKNTYKIEMKEKEFIQ